MSNKKLTTEEKIEKSKKIHEEIERRKKSLNERIDDLKKLDAEIAEELEKAYMVDMQELGKHTAAKIGEGFSLKEYTEIVDCIFTLDEVTDYVNSEREKLSRKAESEKSDEIEPAEEVAHSDAGSVSA
ncbi:MAG: hypothetical protein K6C68_12880 [Ruminococcus sp.]|nr:hypothetical protein [Ruminococcus sp.]